jgi:hypothetical protein
MVLPDRIRPYYSFDVLDHASIMIEINNGSMLHTGRINVSTVLDAAIPSFRIVLGF